MDERTKEILNRFAKSWDETLSFYDELINNHPGFERLIPIRGYILKLRSAGADNFFRIGTSIHELLISRSVNFGLRSDQKYIRIEALLSNDFFVRFQDGDGNVYREYRLTSLDDIKLAQLLKTLKSTIVD